MLLSEHMYCVVITFKMIDWLEQWICIRFSIKLEHSSMETVWMIQKAAAMGHWWLAASSWQCTCLCLRFNAESFGETSNHPSGLDSLQPRFGALRVLTFSKTKITFEREEFSDYQWDSGKYDSAADGNWENWVRSQGAYFEGDWGVIVPCTMFLVSSIFFNKCLYFSHYEAGYLLDRAYIYRLHSLANLLGADLFRKYFHN